jgi:hypothetical protein
MAMRDNAAAELNADAAGTNAPDAANLHDDDGGVHAGSPSFDAGDVPTSPAVGQAATPMSQPRCSPEAAACELFEFKVPANAPQGSPGVAILTCQEIARSRQMASQAMALQLIASIVMELQGLHLRLPPPVQAKVATARQGHCQLVQRRQQMCSILP